MSRTFALLLVAAATLAPGCRYSSSETPPPLEPDFDRLRAAREPVTGAGGAAPAREVTAGGATAAPKASATGPR